MRRFSDTITWVEDRGFAIDAAVGARMAFVRRTYLHLLLELAAVALVVLVALRSPALRDVAIGLMGRWYVYLLALFGVSLVTRRMLEGRRSIAVQYAAAGIWVFFLGLVVTPLAMIAHAATGSYAVLGQAAVLTGAIFAGLTAYVFLTKRDFSWLGGALWMVTSLALGIGILGILLGWSFVAGSLLYSVLWVVLLGGWVLYDTSNVLHHRHVDQHVAASVDLLVDFVYLFIRIALILLNSRR